MGLANLNSPRVRALYTAIPSFAKAVDVIGSALERFCLVSEPDACVDNPSIDLNRVLIAFNGGKDCTVLLHLVLIASRILPQATGRLRLLYIRDDPSETFEEVDVFVEEIKSKYTLEAIEVGGTDMRSALDHVVAEHPEVCAIFMGTRSTDPNAKWMDYVCKTSAGWPQMNLVAPILGMTYAEVWQVIHELSLEYCSLYSRGYTSIGRKSNTVPNPELMIQLPDGSVEYAHADQLVDDSKERLGRT